MAYDKRRIEKSQYVLGVKPSTLDAPIAAQAGDFDAAPKYEYSSDGKTVTWTNRDRMPKVAAQAGDEPMGICCYGGSLKPKSACASCAAWQASPRATTATTEALQVCVKALEFRKERSANDEFALNLARIALAEAPRATADVERDALTLLREVVRLDGISLVATVDNCEVCTTGEFDRLTNNIRKYLATTKPGA